MTRKTHTNEQLVADRFDKDVAEHAITVKLRNGKYGHWRCQKPGTWNMGFDIVVWPGSLCYTGDMGDFLFQRTDDMIAFMRTSVRDKSYCAGKCVATGRDGIKAWSEREFRSELADRIRERRREDVASSGSTMAVCRDIISEYENYGSEHDATKAMYESGLWDGSDLPSCKEYTIQFLWCLHAIKWFCERVGTTTEENR